MTEELPIPKLMIFRSILIRAILFSCISACSAISDKPSTTCLNVSGEYLFKPRDKKDTKGSRLGLFSSAYEFLWNTHSCKDCNVDRLIINQLDCQSLLVKPFFENQALTELPLSIKEWTQSILLVRENNSSIKNDIALNVETHARDYISVDSNKDLVLKRDVSKFTWILFIPYWETDGFEITFPRIRK